ncbi:MAG: hypothetical protein HZA46_19445 [Planctomycetales bacterium]|nr:hypothetical protein [Planctomycetales bacterium]
MAQIEAGETSPDRLHLGTVRVGATVEASVRVFADGDDLSNIQFKVDSPSFVRVKQARLGTQTYGSKGTFIVCDIFISVNTALAGNNSAPIGVQIGEQQFEIPVTVTVAAKEADGTRLLVAGTPFHRASTEDATIFNAWLELVTSAKLDCHYLDVEPFQPVLRELDLSAFDVVLLGGGGLINVLQTDVAKLNKFLSDGGRVVVFANHFMKGSVAKANELLVPHGLRMTDTEPQGTGGYHLAEIGPVGIADTSLTKDVRMLKFHRPSPVAVTDKVTETILVSAPPYPGEGFVAVADAGKGEIVAVGISLWWNWIASKEEKGADNAVFLKNLLTKPRKKD